MRLDYPDPELAAGAVRLRRWDLSDSACVAEAGRDETIPTFTTVPRRASAAETEAFVQRQWGRQTSGEGLALAVAELETDEAIGAVTLTHRTGQQAGGAGIGYWLVERARGRGLMAPAVGLLSRWALAQPGIARVEALVEPGNVASQRVVEAAGFQREGLLRSYLAFGDRRADAFVYSLVAEDLDR